MTHITCILIDAVVHLHTVKFKWTLENSTWLQCACTAVTKSINLQLFFIIFGSMHKSPINTPLQLSWMKHKAVFRIWYCKCKGRTDLYSPSIPLPEFQNHLSTSPIRKVPYIFYFYYFNEDEISIHISFACAREQKS